MRQRKQSFEVIIFNDRIMPRIFVKRGLGIGGYEDKSMTGFLTGLELYNYVCDVLAY